MRKTILTAVLSSICITSFASGMPTDIMPIQYTQHQIQELSQKIQEKPQDTIYSLKKIFPQLVIYKTTPSQVAGFTEVTSNIGTIYISGKDHILLSSQKVMLFNYKRLDTTKNADIRQIVADSTGFAVQHDNIDGDYHYFQGKDGVTIITRKDIAKYPYAIMGAFSTIDMLARVKNKEPVTKTQVTTPRAIPAPVSMPKPIHEANTSQPLTGTKKEQGVIKAINFINDNYSQDLVKFKATHGDKGTITVFTDYTCPHCQELHKHLKDFLDKGYNVDYIMMPRDYNNKTVIRNMKMALCAVNPQKAVESLYSTQQLPADLQERPNCTANIQNNLNMATGFNIQGTPMLIGSSGKISSGFNSIYSSLQQLDML